MTLKHTHTHKKQQLTFIHLRRDGANFWLLWSAELGLTAGIAVTQDALRPAGEFRCALTPQRLEPSVGFYRFWAELEPLLDCQTRLKTDSNSSRSKWRQSGTQSPRDRPTGELRTPRCAAASQSWCLLLFFPTCFLRVSACDFSCGILISFLALKETYFHIQRPQSSRQRSFTCVRSPEHRDQLRHLIY